MGIKLVQKEENQIFRRRTKYSAKNWGQESTTQRERQEARIGLKSFIVDYIGDANRWYSKSLMFM